MRDLIFYNEETNEINTKRIPVVFNDIQEANKTMITMDIKGKDYVQVNERIKAFRMVYPTGFIKTEMLKNNDGICVIKAAVGYYDKLEHELTDTIEEIILATGTAEEIEGSTFINKTSYIENCETSAIGRALGIAGFGIDTSVASAEEVQNAIANQKKKTGKTYMTDTSEDETYKLKLIDEIYDLIDETKTDETKVLKEYQVEEIEQMTKEQMESCKILLLKKKNK